MKRLFLIVVLTAFAFSSGCSTKFPYGVSWDRHNFLSTPHMPLSLSLKDTYSGEIVWTLDVPVNQMAVVDLAPMDSWVPGQSPHMPAKKIAWDIFDPGTNVGHLMNHQDLNGNPVLLIVKIREKEPMTTAATAAPMPAETASSKPMTKPAAPQAAKPAPTVEPAPASAPIVPPQPQFQPSLSADDAPRR